MPQPVSEPLFFSASHRCGSSAHLCLARSLMYRSTATAALRPNVTTRFRRPLAPDAGFPQVEVDLIDEHAGDLGPPHARTERYWLLAYPSERLSRSETTQDRKSTRLNSSHRTISYAVFCLKK